MKTSKELVVILHFQLFTVSQYNFFTRTLKEWNTLPSFLLDQPSVGAFKSAVTNYFSLSH